MGTANLIKEIAYDDYRQHIPGVVCIIIECSQYVGFGSVLKVLPEDYDMKSIPEDGIIRPFNVICAGVPGIYGFPTFVKDNYNAYVMTNTPSMLDGKLAFLIPKTFLNRSVGSPDKLDIVEKKDLDDLVMKKDAYIKSRSFS